MRLHASYNQAVEATAPRVFSFVRHDFYSSILPGGAAVPGAAPHLDVSPKMERQSQHATKFIRELSDLSDRLAARDVVVGSLHAEYSAFGFWLLIARKHHEAVRLFWDGRDGSLTVEGSPIRDSSAPNEWKRETVKGFDRISGDDPLRFVEEYLTKRFPV